MIEFLSQNLSQLLLKIGEHLIISLFALVLGIVVAVPVGVILVKSKKMSKVVIAVASILQTIPSLALLAMMVPLFGVGKIPAIIAIFIYSLLPILRNTYLGMDNVNSSILDAAKGMGMTFWQRIVSIQAPLAAPVIMSGIRLSAVYVVSWTTLASYIGAGGLGDFIFVGLNTYNVPMIIMGAIPVTIIALIFDIILGIVERKVEPKTNSNKSAKKTLNEKFIVMDEVNESINDSLKESVIGESSIYKKYNDENVNKNAEIISNHRAIKENNEKEEVY